MTGARPKVTRHSAQPHTSPRQQHHVTPSTYSRQPHHPGPPPLEGITPIKPPPLVDTPPPVALGCGDDQFPGPESRVKSKGTRKSRLPKHVQRQGSLSDSDSRGSPRKRVTISDSEEVKEFDKEEMPQIL